MSAQPTDARRTLIDSNHPDGTLLARQRGTGANRPVAASGISPDSETGEVVLPAGPLSRERIVGMSTQGKAFTLETCHASSWELAGIVNEQFVRQIVLEGARYGPGEPVAFNELRVRYTQLDAWVATSGLNVELASEGETATGWTSPSAGPKPSLRSLPISLSRLISPGH